MYVFVYVCMALHTYIQIKDKLWASKMSLQDVLIRWSRDQDATMHVTEFAQALNEEPLSLSLNDGQVCVQRYMNMDVSHVYICTRIHRDIHFGEYMNVHACVHTYIHTCRLLLFGPCVYMYAHT
jgi:hypothetical protein